MFEYLSINFNLTSMKLYWISKSLLNFFFLCHEIVFFSVSIFIQACRIYCQSTNKKYWDLTFNICLCGWLWKNRSLLLILLYLLSHYQHPTCQRRYSRFPSFSSIFLVCWYLLDPTVRTTRKNNVFALLHQGLAGNIHMPPLPLSPPLLSVKTNAAQDISSFCKNMSSTTIYLAFFNIGIQ